MAKRGYIAEMALGDCLGVRPEDDAPILQLFGYSLGAFAVGELVPYLRNLNPAEVSPPDPAEAEKTRACWRSLIGLAVGVLKFRVEHQSHLLVAHLVGVFRQLVPHMDTGPPEGPEGPPARRRPSTAGGEAANHCGDSAVAGVRAAAQARQG